MLQPRWKRSLGSCAISIALLGDVIKSFPPLIQRVEFIFEFWGARRQKLQVASHVSLELVERSLATARELAVRPGPQVLLHGDLHAGNVLDGGDHRGLVAVNPRACVGDSAFDLIDWVLADAGDEHRMRQRAEWLAGEVGADPTSLWRWCACTAVLVIVSQLARGSNPTVATKPLLSLVESA
jgi:streptomycin 6-kinase